MTVNPIGAAGSAQAARPAPPVSRPESRETGAEHDQDGDDGAAAVTRAPAAAAPTLKIGQVDLKA